MELATPPFMHRVFQPIEGVREMSAALNALANVVEAELKFIIPNGQRPRCSNPRRITRTEGAPATTS